MAVVQAVVGAAVSGVEDLAGLEEDAAEVVVRPDVSKRKIL